MVCFRHSSLLAHDSTREILLYISTNKNTVWQSRLCCAALCWNIWRQMKFSIVLLCAVMCWCIGIQEENQMDSTLIWSFKNTKMYLLNIHSSLKRRTIFEYDFCLIMLNQYQLNWVSFWLFWLLKDSWPKIQISMGL